VAALMENHISSRHPCWEPLVYAKNLKNLVKTSTYALRTQRWACRIGL